MARVAGDERTLNRNVLASGEELTEKEIYAIMEDISGEKLERKIVNAVPSLNCLESLTP